MGKNRQEDENGETVDREQVAKCYLLTEEIISRDYIRIPHLEEQFTWRLDFGFINSKGRILHFINNFIFCFEIVEVEDKSPVEIALARQWPKEMSLL